MHTGLWGKQCLRTHLDDAREVAQHRVSPAALSPRLRFASIWVGKLPNRNRFSLTLRESGGIIDGKLKY